MAAQKDCILKGKWWECCIREGQCPLWFGRDLWEEAGTCISFQTYQVEEGQIQGVDMKGIRIIHVFFGVGPKWADVVAGVEEVAAYISDNATDKQKRLLEPIVTKDLSKVANIPIVRKFLGLKYVKIDISQKNGTNHTTMPFGEQKISLTVGGDGKNPIGITNGPSYLTNIKICSTDLWNYHDYGRNVEYHNTSGGMADFCYF